MRVLITGGAGQIGRAVALHLQSLGWEVAAIDMTPEPNLPDIRYAVCDIMDFDGLRAQMRGCEAVVHMAALKSAYNGTAQDIYKINAAGTFNVYEAAAKEGIRRVVQASSINAIGCAWNTGEFDPRYLPIDEDHPIHTTDPYSFSKQQIEEIGAYFWRRDGISGTALRFPGVADAKRYGNPESAARKATLRAFLDELAALPDAEREPLLAAARERCLAWRATRPMEYPAQSLGWPPPDSFEETLFRVYALDRYNLWAWMDERDAAQAIEKSLTANYGGSHPLFVNDAHNWLDYDSATLARLFFPDSRITQPLTGSQSLVSIARARDLIGFAPHYSAHGI